jgi:hypothetical protein
LKTRSVAEQLASNNNTFSNGPEMVKKTLGKRLIQIRSLDPDSSFYLFKVRIPFQSFDLGLLRFH